MLRRGRPVGPEFVESAPVCMAFGAEVAAPPAAVYRELAECVEDWPDWFGPLVAVARTPEGRQVRLRGGGQFWETVLVAEPATRYAYRTDRTNAPGMTALVEDWLLVPAGGATRVRWTVATDGTAVYRAVVRAARPAIGRSFRDAMRALDRRLTLPES
ncbi:SRPBCC family protein [Streptomyces bomunensis]|uniref:SRPBCC family protein n=2 Tax=Streptomyces montanisoli TaxID=2798581 RepID=A0A940MIT4_9ACTN|nr:SRPBCC family protein [Streptomyces montanisoli]MBP0460066.1 SRPBCC family protein [Streptomyces montanisoli]